MKALVFAAGLGTRLKPLTDRMPKALVPVAGRPLIDHVLSKLRASGFDDITVNVHHFGSRIRDYLAACDPSVHISDETGFLRETGGGILHARPFLGGGPFLVHNVDILSNIDLSSFVAECREDALSTLVVSSRETSRYFLFDGNLRLCGWTNVKTGEVRSPYPDLDPSECRKLAFSGIHFISGRIFDVFEEENCPERFPITDFYVSICDRYPIYGHVPEGFRMVDVGKLQTLSEAESFAEELSL